MGIYLELLRKPFVDLRGHVRGRVAYAREVLRNAEGYFVPREITIWRNATLEELGGQPLKPKMNLAENTSYAAAAQPIEGYVEESSLDDLLSSIIVIRGTWEFNSKSLPGYISVNNDFGWRRVYGDIEVDAYPNSPYSDLIDILWEDPGLRSTLVDGFIKELARYKDPRVELSSIFYSIGVPSPSEEISMIRAAYFASRRDLVAYMLASYRSSLREKGDKEILPHITPFKQNFIVTKLLDNPTFKQELDNILSSSKMVEITVGSVAFIGVEPDSFANAYKQLSERLLSKIAKVLPRDEEIAQRMAQALTPGGWPA